MNSEETKTYAREIGADLVGIADLALLEDITTIPENLLEGFTHALSVGVRLPDQVLDGIVDKPTPLYAHAYRTANTLLDQITFRLAQRIQDEGYKATPLPAALIVDEENYMGHLSAKAVARAAGLGWQGKSLLIINPEIGPRFRVATVLTDMPLAPDEPLANKCAGCTECVKACPAQAIRGAVWENYPDSRAEALDVARCADLLTYTFKNLPHIGHTICGICVKVCPWGKPADK